MYSEGRRDFAIAFVFNYTPVNEASKTNVGKQAYHYFVVSSRQHLRWSSENGSDLAEQSGEWYIQLLPVMRSTILKLARCVPKSFSSLSFKGFSFKCGGRGWVTWNGIRKLTHNFCFLQRQVRNSYGQNCAMVLDWKFNVSVRVAFSRNQESIKQAFVYRVWNDQLGCLVQELNG